MKPIKKLVIRTLKLLTLTAFKVAREKVVRAAREARLARVVRMVRAAKGTTAATAWKV